MQRPDQRPVKLSEGFHAQETGPQPVQMNDIGVDGGNFRDQMVRQHGRRKIVERSLWGHPYRQRAKDHLQPACQLPHVTGVAECAGGMTGPGLDQ